MRQITRIVKGAPVADDLIKYEAGTVVWSAESSSEVPLVLKLYRHRGLINTLRGFVVKFRAEREYERLAYLIRCGVPCTAPYEWVRGYSRRHGFYEILATVTVPGSENLQTCLQNGREVDLRLLFETVRRMHESGFCHHALFARNVLVRDNDDSGCCYAISDVPRSRILPYSIVGSRLALFDLADLITDLHRLGVAIESIPLEAYGIDEKSERHLERMIIRHKRSKLRRVGRDAESRARHLIGWAVALVSANRLVVPSEDPRASVEEAEIDYPKAS